MTNKLEQAARQALVALEDVMADFDGSWALADTAITAMREALAEQAEQEPVAWGCRFQDGSIHDCICPESHAECEGDYNIPLYAAPVRTKDLTDDEISEVVFSIVGDTPTNYERTLSRAVIAADREKNRG